MAAAKNPLTHAYDGVKMLQALERLEASRPEVAALQAAGIDVAALQQELAEEYDRLNALYQHFFGSAGRAGPAQ
jgi:hypothetical protein